KFVLKKGETVTVRVEFLDGKLQVVADGKIIGEDTARQPAAANAWTPTPEQQAWLDNASKLGAAERRVMVDARLRELNAEGVYHPGNYYKPTLAPTEGAVTSALLNQGGHESGTFAIWPLAAFPTITTIDLRGTGVLDFAPLTRLPLTELNINLVLDNTKAEQVIRSIATLKTINGKPAAEFWQAREHLRTDI